MYFRIRLCQWLVFVCCTIVAVRAPAEEADDSIKTDGVVAGAQANADSSNEVAAVQSTGAISSQTNALPEEVDAKLAAKEGEDVDPAPEEQLKRPGFFKKLLYYIPNRVLDLADIFRLRLRVGPGLLVGARATDFLSLEAGHYRSFYLGLPGPRYPARFKSPLGIERERGLEFCGINATDDLSREPDYSATEFGVSLHLFMVGAGVGLDPVELGDFLAGLIFRDPRGDDIETPRPPGAFDRREHWSLFAADKPDVFDSYSDRIDYVRSNMVWGVDERLRMVDVRFADESAELIDTPPAELRIGIYIELEVDRGVSVKLDPDFSMHVDLPNIENRWEIFVTTRDPDELPGTDPTERDSGANVGIRRTMKNSAIKLDVGVKARLPPEAFALIKWVPRWEAGEWRILPQIRAYVETSDGPGQLNSLTAYRWIGKRQRGLFRSTSALRWKSETSDWTWEQSFSTGYILKLVEEWRRGKSVKRYDGAHGIGLRVSVYGTLEAENDLDRVRVTLPYRMPLYSDWVYLEVAPEVNFRYEDDVDDDNYDGWNTVPSVRVGIDMLFSSPRKR